MDPPLFAPPLAVPPHYLPAQTGAQASPPICARLLPAGTVGSATRSKAGLQMLQLMQFRATIYLVFPPGVVTTALRFSTLQNWGQRG